MLCSKSGKAQHREQYGDDHVGYGDRFWANRQMLGEAGLAGSQLALSVVAGWEVDRDTVEALTTGAAPSQCGEQEGLNRHVQPGL